ncbi:MAG TPA: hypothetical protein VFX95_09595 [Caulobacteraceae bacterium]|nr:hypothetical protein [Caulobacteraceae bacterium]
MNPDQTGGPSKRRRPSGRPTKPEARPEHRPDAEAERRHTEEQLDRGLEQTFPASDPVSIQSDR